MVAVHHLYRSRDVYSAADGTLISSLLLTLAASLRMSFPFLSNLCFIFMNGASSRRLCSKLPSVGGGFGSCPMHRKVSGLTPGLWSLYQSVLEQDNVSIAAEEQVMLSSLSTGVL